MKRNRIAILLPVAAAVGIAASCTTSGGLDPIVIDLSAAKTPTPGAAAAVTAAPAPTPSPAPSSSSSERKEPAPELKEKPSTAAASVPAADLTPPPREKPEMPAAPVPAASPSGAAPEAVVASVRRALVRGDGEAASALIGADARMYQPADRLVASGADSVRARLTADLAASRATAAEGLTVSGDFVVERSAAGGFTVYEVRAGKIARIWIFR